MKIKLWEFEYEFDRDDAKIVIPITILALSLVFTNISSGLLIAISAFYYLFYFFSEKAAEKAKAFVHKWLHLKCPHCKSKKVLLQGYQSYKSDEQYPYYFCSECHESAVLIETGLIIPYINKPKKQKEPQKTIDDFEEIAL